MASINDLVNLANTVVSNGIQARDFPDVTLVRTEIGGVSVSVTPNEETREAEGDEGETP